MSDDEGSAGVPNRSRKDGARRNGIEHRSVLPGIEEQQGEPPVVLRGQTYCSIDRSLPINAVRERTLAQPRVAASGRQFAFGP
jgi:hypothetical protein